MTGAKALAIGAGYATNVYLARVLGPDAYGLFGVVITVLFWLELVVAEGLPLWVARTTDSAAEWRRAVPRRYLLAQFALSLSLVAFLFAAAPWLARVFDAPSAQGLFRLAALDIPIYAFYNLFLSVLLGAQLFGAHSTSVIAYYTTKLASTVALVGVAGLAVTGAVLGSIGASLVGFSIAFVMVLVHAARQRAAARGRGSAMHSEPEASSTRHRTRDVVAGSVSPALLLLAQALMFSASLWLVRALDPGGAAGYYRAASLVAQVPIELAAGFTWALYAAYSVAHRAGDDALCRHYTSQATRLVMTAGIAWAALVVPTSQPLMSLLFSSDYAQSGPILQALTVGFSVGMLALTLGPTLLIRGHQGLLLGYAAGLVVFQVALTFVLTTRFGPIGAAVASGTTLALAGVAMLVFVKADLEFALWPTLARTAIPGIVVAAAAFAVPTARPVWLLALYPVLGALFVGLMWLTKGLTRADFEALRGGLDG